jgi:hypothetical protein
MKEEEKNNTANQRIAQMQHCSSIVTWKNNFAERVESIDTNKPEKI